MVQSAAVRVAWKLTLEQAMQPARAADVVMQLIAMMLIR